MERITSNQVLTRISIALYAYGPVQKKNGAELGMDKTTPSVYMFPLLDTAWSFRQSLV